jgi:hypothetical protein
MFLYSDISSFQTPPLQLAKKNHLFRQSFSLHPLCFFITFFFPSALASCHWWLPFYTMTLSDEHRVTLSLLPSCPSLSYLDQHCFCIFAPPFVLSWSNELATVINSMVTGSIGHALRLAVWSKGLQKTWGNPWIFFLTHQLFHCRFCSHCTSKLHY